jgi:hypothetical protein
MLQQRHIYRLHYHSPLTAFPDGRSCLYSLGCGRLRLATTALELDHTGRNGSSGAARLQSLFLCESFELHGSHGQSGAAVWCYEAPVRPRSLVSSVVSLLGHGLP